MDDITLDLSLSEINRNVRLIEDEISLREDSIDDRSVGIAMRTAMRIGNKKRKKRLAKWKELQDYFSSPHRR